ncbi:MAG: LpxL/LpxP family Kdo(2)-lipid IV(A) lauroyl/palmitoleoyl acyltransferase [Gammaproteobacteria bacterium]|nr:LpxL/LpxP family Kdo(2)-lipid IV(A) lauroyl/palmitoleoyl acyltransferase [Gammaproteobacteria bacterium]
MNSATSAKTPLSQFYAPRYWPTWAGLLLLWLLAHLPFPLLIRIGQAIGYLSYLFARERRNICRINLELCFPEVSPDERKSLLLKTFLSNGIGVMEAALSWCRNPENFRDRVTVSGLENLKKAKAEGRGVLLLCAHFTTLEFAGALLSLFESMDVTYRKHKNPLFEAVMSNSRKRLYPSVIERENVRDAFRSLKQGHIIWYAPDQDYGARHSVFVPFFGVEAATITATTRFARANDSEVIFFSHYRTEDNSGYHLEFSEPIENYPSGDDKVDAARINTIIELAIRKHPEQYLWLHKRFKTQAAGKGARPYPQKPRR